MTDAYEHEADDNDLDIDQGAGDGAEGSAEAAPAEPAKPPLEPAELERRASDLDRALKAERAKNRAERRAYEAELAQFRAQRQEPAPKPPEPIDPEADPIGALVQTREQLAAFQRAQKQQEQQTAQQRQQEQYFARIEATVTEYEAEFTKANPDYPKAAEFLTASRSQEYQQAGYTPQQTQAALQREYHDIVVNAVNTGRDPAEVFYTLAKSRGFKVGQTKLDAIANGQKATGALNGGGRGQDGLTFGAVADLDGEDFDKAFAKLRATAKKREAGR